MAHINLKLLRGAAVLQDTSDHVVTKQGSTEACQGKVPKSSASGLANTVECR